LKTSSYGDGANASDNCYRGVIVTSVTVHLPTCDSTNKVDDIKCNLDKKSKPLIKAEAPQLTIEKSNYNNFSGTTCRS
jgi:hypothetical protein